MRRYGIPGLFITGTGTGVGKSYVAALIARQLVAEGRRVGVYKPVASGCRSDAGALVSDDALALWEAAGKPGELERVCPQRFAAGLAPHLAARAEGRRVDAELLRQGLDYWSERSEIVLVEGVGGLMSPLTDDEYAADLAEDMAFPLVIVARNELGTIHDTLATLVAAATFRHGLDVAGLVLCDLPPEQLDPSAESNADELARRCVPPLLAHLAWEAREFNRAVDWFRLAGQGRKPYR
ncbi:MAG TPA: dethiobiotin synthase [Pirellulales bacterium]|nr:dethiobiotin synthase [Pirellulales bacterium]